jgi:hypothetical protein
MTKNLCCRYMNALSDEQTSLESIMLKDSFKSSEDCTYQQESIRHYFTKFSVRANKKFSANPFCGLLHVTWMAGGNPSKFCKCTLKYSGVNHRQADRQTDRQTDIQTDS